MSRVVAVFQSPAHTMSKPECDAIRLVAGLGVEGDAHSGVTVKHRSRVRRDPTQPNLRQVHLMQAELFDELVAKGMSVEPGRMGENITTRDLDLLALPVGTVLRLGDTASIRVTGLRNPCHQLDGIHEGLMQAVLHHGPNGELVRRAGVMAVVLEGGPVRAGDMIRVDLPDPPHRPLEPV